MANTFQSISSGLGILKNYYQGPIVDALNNEVPILRAIEKETDGWSGVKMIRPVRVRRNQGVGATSDGGTLPQIGAQTTVQAEVSAKYVYSRAGITGPMLKASKNDAGSFVRSLAYEVKMAFNDIKSDINRQLSWDGTGDLARLNSAAAGTSSITIKGREDTEPALKFVDVGMVLDIVTSGGVYKAQGVTVNSISSGTGTSTTATLVLDTNVTASADDILIRSNSLNQEMQGLLYALDGGTTTVYGVDRSSYISFQGNVSDLNAAQLTLDAMQSVYNSCLRRGGVGSLDAIWTDFDSLKMYQKLLTPDKRYVNSVKGDGGFAEKEKFYLDFNGIPVVPDKDAPPRMFFLPAKALRNCVLSEMEIASEGAGGSDLIPQSEADAFEIRIRHFANLFNESPASCGVLFDYTSP